ncbi:MAG: alanine racemase [Endomicrobium sp.]|jgi:alanine racemase|nr:alanine racemase [Endomicrobium sp.]
MFNIKTVKQSIFFKQNWIELDKSAFHFNLKKVRNYIAQDTKIMLVIKSNAYGHGCVEFAKEANKSGISQLAVSSLEEGIKLRESGVKSNILLLDTIFPFENFQVAIAHSLTPTISSIAQLPILEHLAIRLNKRINFHLKIDTGMGRIGISSNIAKIILQKISKMSCVNMVGLYTHFAVADTDPSFTQLQLNIFTQIVRFARVYLNFKFTAHSANSAALLKNKYTHLDMVRFGLLAYGLPPFKNLDKIFKLKPVLTWKTLITFLKKVPAGFSISYGRTFVTNKMSTIATIPVGYSDGYNRILSNKGHVLVHGKYCPIIGRITMTETMIDVTDVKNVNLFDEVVLIGYQNKSQIKVEDLASLQNTINYEVICSIAEHIPRIVI